MLSMVFSPHAIFAALALLVVLLPASWHWRARNVATLSIILWLSLANISMLVNSILWSDNYSNIAPVWCDIGEPHSYLFRIKGSLAAIRAPQALVFAIPACSLSQMRRLEAVASVRQTSLSQKQKVRRTYVEVALCIVFPLAMLALSYIVQANRFSLDEGLGCVLQGYISWPSVVLVNVIPLAVSLAAFTYAGKSS